MPTTSSKELIAKVMRLLDRLQEIGKKIVRLRESIQKSKEQKTIDEIRDTIAKS